MNPNSETTSIDALHAAQLYLRIAEKNLEEIDDQILRAARSLAQDAARFEEGAGASNAGRISMLIGATDHLRDLHAKRDALVAKADTLHEIVAAAEIGEKGASR
jgi:hypothetical protein